MLHGVLEPVRPAPAEVLLKRLGWLLAALGWAASLALAPTGPAALPPTGVSASVPAARQARNIAAITITGEINATTATSVKRRIQQAAGAGANAIVIQLDTPGGEVGAVLEICTAIKQSPVPNTVAWVDPNAYSGGAIIALACREIVLSRGATMGDALPIQVSFGMLNKLPENERQKILAPLLAEVVDSARLRGHDEKLVQGLVTLGVELWRIESTERPGEILFIDRGEFRTLFGTDPSGSSPRLVGASRVGGDRPAPVAPAGAVPAAPTEGPAPGDADAAGGPDAMANNPDPFARGEPADPTQFQPAAPRLEGLTKQVTDGLSNASRRPVIDASQRGRWRLVEHVSDGRGVFTFKQADLFDFRLAHPALTADGTVNTDEELKAFFGATHLVRLDQSWSEALVRFLTNTVVRMVLIAVFLLGLFVEMTHPGLVAPGTVAAAALCALVAPPLLIGAADWWPIAAIGGGVVLLALEVLVFPGFGIPGVVGLVSLFAGLVGVISPSGLALFPDSPAGQGGVLYAVATVAISGSTALGAMFFVARHFGSLPILNRLILQDTPRDEGDGLLAAMGSEEGPVRVGDRGVALTPLRPSGRIQVGERVVDVVADVGLISPGEPVKIVSVSAFRIVVDRDRETPSGERA